MAALVGGAAVQRNTREENAQLKSGKVPEDWEAGEAKHKRQQKDTDARWTKKHGRSHYGYKNHVNVDNENKLIRKYAVTVSIPVEKFPRSAGRKFPTCISTHRRITRSLWLTVAVVCRVCVWVSPRAARHSL